MASTGREPDDWSSVVNECGSMGTDVGFALNRFVQGTVTLAFADPPPLTSDIETQSETMVEDTAPDLGSEMHWTRVSKQENRKTFSQDAAFEESPALLNAAMREKISPSRGFCHTELMLMQSLQVMDGQHYIWPQRLKQRM